MLVKLFSVLHVASLLKTPQCESLTLESCNKQTALTVIVCTRVYR